MSVLTSASAHRGVLTILFSMLAGPLLSSCVSSHLNIGTQTFYHAGNGTSLNTFTVPVGFHTLMVQAWGGGAGGGGGHASRAASNNWGYGGGGGAGGEYVIQFFTITTGPASSPSTVMEYSPLTISVGGGGAGGAGQAYTDVNNDGARSGQAGTRSEVSIGQTVLVQTPCCGTFEYGGGGYYLNAGHGGGGPSGFTCGAHGSDGSGINGGNGGSACNGGGGGGAAGIDPGCNSAGNGGSNGSFPGGAGGGGSGGRTCSVLGGRHSGGSGGNGADGVVTISWY